MTAATDIGHLDYLWLGFVVYWTWQREISPSPKQQEGLSTVLMRNAWFGTGALLLLASGLSLGPLDRRFLAGDVTSVHAAGWMLTAGGLAFVVWSRRMLGRHWSGRISLKTDHQLIRSGPYALVRHPIYSA